MGDQREELDQEWYELIEAAKKLGLSVEDVRRFLISEKESNDKEKG
ncbi:anti-repressor SinI family protein [Siminovitchia fordii]|uniref:Sin domain-containing protein n=1 Tax=Siminovitchia fordii TaxID=254759 RepID=A0ABQ4KC36_9BACI|nr:anti-repressor SinI family protein [Siminovitchia fordii]GIN22596.1 hypothetical protein J1TS3_37300 [Siminovitchia fordii]